MKVVVIDCIGLYDYLVMMINSVFRVVCHDLFLLGSVPFNVFYIIVLCIYCVFIYHVHFRYFIYIYLPYLYSYIILFQMTLTTSHTTRQTFSLDLLLCKHNAIVCVTQPESRVSQPSPIRTGIIGTSVNNLLKCYQFYFFL